MRPILERARVSWHSIDAFSRSPRLPSTDIFLDALEQALGLIHHRTGECSTCRFAIRSGWQTGIEPSVGSKGDSYDNALAESVIGLFRRKSFVRTPGGD